MHINMYCLGVVYVPLLDVSFPPPLCDVELPNMIIIFMILNDTIIYLYIQIFYNYIILALLKPRTIQISVCIPALSVLLLLVGVAPPITCL